MTPASPLPDSPAVRLRPALDAVPPYRAGRAPVPREGVTAYKIASNENPYPPLPRVAEAIVDAVTQVNRYPDAANADLTGALASRLGVRQEELALGTGSVGVLGQIVQATCDPGDEVVYAWRSFEAYPLVVGLAGARSVPVPLTEDARHDLAALADAVTDRTRLVLLCTPNNPTGPVLTEREVRDFLAAVPRDLLVVIDEAYLEFVEPEHAWDALSVWRDHANIVLLRTFSKAYGLAGLRVGYAVAHARVAEALRKTGLPFGVNGLAQVAAVASLANEGELRVRVGALVLERARVLAGLREQGWPVPDTQANFVWLPLGEQSTGFAELCESEGLSVRAFPAEGVRASIGEVAANDRLLELAARFRRR